ncbi:MAG: CPBP family intramembrane metalloprotease [Candidatus Lambdaproteobacteria bacterium]|nr:CPBP family intramembrane metalloprotease [Candidatus Lambdaproteobacteria bacterium]
MTPQPARTLIVVAAAFYLPMLVSAFWLEPPGVLVVGDPLRLAGGLAAALAGGALVVLGSRRVARRTGWGRALREELRAVLGPLGSGAILALALLSAFGEELLFRGVMHPRLGLWPTALLFGLFHWPWRRRLIPWTLFALVLGLALGGLTTWSRSLWPAIVLHFVINHYNLHDLVEQEPGGATPSPPPTA